MSNFREELIKLGKEHPTLRKDIRPVMAALEKDAQVSPALEGVLNHLEEVGKHMQDRLGGRSHNVVKGRRGFEVTVQGGGDPPEPKAWQVRVDITKIVFKGERVEATFSVDYSDRHAYKREPMGGDTMLLNNPQFDASDFTGEVEQHPDLHFSE